VGHADLSGHLSPTELVAFSNLLRLSCSRQQQSGGDLLKSIHCDSNAPLSYYVVVRFG
jgi:hypothetical protein